MTTFTVRRGDTLARLDAFAVQGGLALATLAALMTRGAVNVTTVATLALVAAAPALAALARGRVDAGYLAGLAWAAGQWNARHLLASLLTAPEDAPRLLAEADLDLL